MAGGVLPLEVDDIILDHLYHDRTTLASCALVCRSWLPRSRLHLWWTLRLECSKEELLGFRDLLETSSGIAQYIRHIIIVHRHRADDLGEPGDESVLYTLVEMFVKLPALDMLTFEKIYLATSSHCLSSPIKHSLHSVRKLQFTNCMFRHFCDMRRVRDACPNLTTFHIDKVHWGSCTSAYPEAKCGTVERTSQLQDVNIGQCFSRTRVFEWLLTTTAPGSIQRLSLSQFPKADPRLIDLFEQNGSSLSHLEIECPSPDFCPGSEPYLDLTRSIALRSITLGVPTHYDPYYMTFWLISILNSLPAVSTLSHVSFTIVPINLLEWMEAPNKLNAFGWARIVGVLKGTRFNQVRKLSIIEKTDGNKRIRAHVVLEKALRRVVLPVFRVLEERNVEVEVRCE